MTKKTFVKFAANFKEQIRDIKAYNSGNDLVLAMLVIKISIDNFCTIAKEENNLFNKSKFLKACGL